jgi:lysozyme
MRVLASVFLACVAISTPCLAGDFPVISDHVTSKIQLETIESDSLGVAGSPARSLIPIAFDLIKYFESWIPMPYNDASMFCTIGYGHLIDKFPCSQCGAKLSKFNPPPPLNIDTGNHLLDQDTSKARLAIQNSVHVLLSDEQFGALTSLVFNIGGENFHVRLCLNI